MLRKFVKRKNEKFRIDIVLPGFPEKYITPVIAIGFRALLKGFAFNSPALSTTYKPFVTPHS